MLRKAHQLLSQRDVSIVSEEDAELTSVRHYIQHGNWHECKMPYYTCVKNELCVLGKLVLRGTRIVIPRRLIDDVLHLAHEGHQGIVKMKRAQKQPRMDNDAEKICRSCHGCQVVSQLSPPEPMQRTEPPTGPWQDVAIDMMRPLSTGENLLVIVDYYSRFFEVVSMQSTTTEKIIGALIPIFAIYGYPFSVKSDNGSQFQSKEFKSFLLEHGIEHHASPPLWPQANGEVERQNRTLLKILKVVHMEGKGWK